MRLADDYADARFTTELRQAAARHRRQRARRDGYAGGGTTGQTYKYLGPNKRLDLGAQNYADTTLWAPLGGEAGGLYRYLGRRTTRTKLDLGLQDYTDTSLWQLVSGDEGIVYEWMGPTTTFDLAAPPIRLHRPRLVEARARHALIPQGINVSESNSTPSAA